MNVSGGSFWEFRMSSSWEGGRLRLGFRGLQEFPEGLGLGCGGFSWGQLYDYSQQMAQEIAKLIEWLSAHLFGCLSTGHLFDLTIDLFAPERLLCAFPQIVSWAVAGYYWVATH
jgi:hypothetical protein